MSYDAKIASVRSLLEQHNTKTANTSFQVNVDKFFVELDGMGGTTEESLSACSWEDLQKCGLPTILARHVATVFRSTSQAPTTESKLADSYIGGKEAKRMTNEQLVGAYNPRQRDSAVSIRLKEISEDKRFIVFKEDGTVDREVTVKLLDELQDHDELEVYKGNGLPRPVYRVGERPDNLANVNPLFPNEKLRGDDCPNIGRSWASVPLATRQLIFLARKSGEIKIESIRDAIEIHNEAIMDKGFDTIAAYCPNAALSFRELRDRGELPSLRVSIGSSSHRTEDPFHGSTTRLRSR